MKKIGLVALLFALCVTVAVVSAQEPVYDHFVHLPLVSSRYDGTPAPTPTPRPTPRPIPTPVADTLVSPVPTPASVCTHPRYNELLEHEGEMACYEQVYIEQVWYVNGECRYIASVFAMEHLDGEGNWFVSWWGGAVWVKDSTSACAYVEPGFVTSLEAKIIGEHGMAGRTYSDGWTMPLLEVK